MVHFKDGSSLQTDTLMLCTGYHYDYSFLDPEIDLKVDDNRITPLYKHFIHTKYPNLGIIGICKTIVPFPMFDMQARFFKSVITGAMSLPSEEDMNLDTQKDYDDRKAAGQPHRYAHNMGSKQWAYNQQLADLAALQPLPPGIERLYDHVHVKRREDITKYKDSNYEVLDDGNEVMIKEVQRIVQ